MQRTGGGVSLENNFSRIFDERESSHLNFCKGNFFPVIKLSEGFIENGIEGFVCA